MIGRSRSSLSIYLLGGLRIEQDGEEYANPFPTVRADSLFAFLLLSPGRAFSRDHLAELLWPGAERVKAQSRLNATLYHVRKFLVDRLGPEADRVLVARRTTVHLSPPAEWGVDVWEVERLLSEADTADPGSREWRRSRREAAALYRGPLLPELEEEWCRDRRYSLEQRIMIFLLLSRYKLSKFLTQ